MHPNLQLIRRYVTDFVNRQDFSVVPQIMDEGYTLDTGGVFVTGRDGEYSGAVARQFRQFPGLTFTLHEILPAGDRVALRFTEHGASNRHEGRCAAWESIGMYRVAGGKLAGCAIEQDYFSRRRQLDEAAPMAVDPPAIAPWDSQVAPDDPAAEAVVRAWLGAGDLTAAAAVEFDDRRATGKTEKILDQISIEILELVSAGGRAAFHAVQHGLLADDFATDLSPASRTPVWLHSTGIVSVEGGKVAGGHVVRDRWGLYRRLSAPASS